jgi:hypothetical protein
MIVWLLENGKEETDKLTLLFSTWDSVRAARGAVARNLGVLSPDCVTVRFKGESFHDSLILSGIKSANAPIIAYGNRPTPS